MAFYCPQCTCDSCATRTAAQRAIEEDRAARALLVEQRRAEESARVAIERDLVLRQGQMIWMLLSAGVDQATVARGMDLKLGTVTARLRYFQEEAARRADLAGQTGFHPWAKRPHTSMAEIPNWELVCPHCGRQCAVADEVHRETGKLVRHRAPNTPVWQRRCPGSDKEVPWRRMY